MKKLLFCLLILTTSSLWVGTLKAQDSDSVRFSKVFLQAKECLKYSTSKEVELNGKIVHLLVVSSYEFSLTIWWEEGNITFTRAIRPKSVYVGRSEETMLSNGVIFVHPPTSPVPYGEGKFSDKDVAYKDIEDVVKEICSPTRSKRKF